MFFGASLQQQDAAQQKMKFVSVSKHLLADSSWYAWSDLTDGTGLGGAYVLNSLLALWSLMTMLMIHLAIMSWSHDQMYGWFSNDACMKSLLSLAHIWMRLADFVDDYSKSHCWRHDDDELLICISWWCWHEHDAWFLSWHKWMRIVGWIQGWLFIHMLIDADAFIWWLLIHVDLDGYELMLTDTMEQIIQCFRCLEGRSKTHVVIVYLISSSLQVM